MKTQDKILDAFNELKIIVDDEVTDKVEQLEKFYLESVHRMDMIVHQSDRQQRVIVDLNEKIKITNDELYENHLVLDWLFPRKLLKLWGVKSGLKVN